MPTLKPLKLWSQISKTKSSTVKFFVTPESKVILEAFYYDGSDLKGFLSCEIDQTQVLELVSCLEAVLSGLQSSFIVRLCDLVLTMAQNGDRSDGQRTVFLWRIESFKDSVFIQYQDEASRFFVILNWLKKAWIQFNGPENGK